MAHYNGMYQEKCPEADNRLWLRDAVQKRGDGITDMGQAQRSDRRSVPQGRGDNISVISGNSSRNRAGSSAQRGRNNGRESTGRRSTNRDGLENLELWEISRDDDNPHMMRLADRERVRYGQRRFRPRQNSERRRAGNPRPVSAVKRRRARKRRLNLYRLFVFLMIGVCLILIYQTTGAVYRMMHHEKAGSGRGIVEIVSEKIEGNRTTPPEMIVDYLEPNEFSRPGTELKKIKSIFVHYTANPGTSAAQNRSYFANLAETQERSASAHFIIGYEGELIQCIPLEEQAYAVATRNEDSVSIECCYLDDDGKFTQQTYDTLVHTLAWLTQEYHLSVDDILRHYDCGGKMCPLYYVEHEDAWEKLLADVESYKEN